MIAHALHRRILTFGTLLLISGICALLAFSGKAAGNTKFSLAIAFDLLVTMPVAYYFLIRRTTISRTSILRVFVAGVLLSSLLLSSLNAELSHFIKTILFPIAEIVLITFLIRRFYVAHKRSASLSIEEKDFLSYCRKMLSELTGSAKLGSLLASEVSVFYYAFAWRDKAVDHKIKFSTHKENGSLLTLNVFLVMFMVETLATHFLFQAWSQTVAWVLTSLSIYTCLQLFAHIRSVKARPVVLSPGGVFFRTGLWGGDAFVPLLCIERIELTKDPIDSINSTSLAFIKNLEKHNICVHFYANIEVNKAFGMKKQTKALLLNIDKATDFKNRLDELMQKQARSTNETKPLV